MLAKKKSQRRTVQKSFIHCVQNGISVAISCCIFEWFLNFVNVNSGS